MFSTFEKLDNSDKEFETLLLGNSHIQAIGEPEIFGGKSFNFGIGGQRFISYAFNIGTYINKNE